MATELYGVSAQIVADAASSAVSTDTRLFFIGASPSGAIGKAVWCASLADAGQKLGISDGDGYNLTEAANAAFSVAGIAGAYFLTVSHSASFVKADYIGNAAIYSGVHALTKELEEAPAACVLACMPGVVDADAIAALVGVCKATPLSCAAYAICDAPIPQDALSGEILTDAGEVEKLVDDECATQCAGRVQLKGGGWLWLAAIRASLMAKADIPYNAPGRVGGNLAIPNAQAWGDYRITETHAGTVAEAAGEGTAIHPVVTLSDTGFNGTLETAIKCNSTDITESVVYTNGVGTMAADISEISEPRALTLESATASGVAPIYLSKSASTELSAGGICAVVRRSGSYFTWGDHTSAFVEGGSAPERARFENRSRMGLFIKNRWLIKYGGQIDEPMTLQMRNDVINEQVNFMYSLVASGALVGMPSCTFEAENNTADGIAQGHFVWNIYHTETPPAKYMSALISYTDAGLDAYTMEA